VGRALASFRVHADERATAFIVFSQADCDASLDFAVALQRPTIQRAIALDGFLLRDHPDNLPNIVARVRGRLDGVAVHSLTTATVRTVDALGRRTPYLLVLDRAGGVVFAASAPQSNDAMLGLTQALYAIRGID